MQHADHWSCGSQSLKRIGATRWRTTPVDTAQLERTNNPVDTRIPVDMSATPVDTEVTTTPAVTALPFPEPTTNACASKACTAVSQEGDKSDLNSSLNLISCPNVLREDTSSEADVACVICMDALGDHVLLPCGHGVYCNACAQKLLARESLARMCPMCRAALTAVVQVRMHTKVGEEGEVLRGMHVKCDSSERN